MVFAHQMGRELSPQARQTTDGERDPPATFPGACSARAAPGAFRRRLSFAQPPRALDHVGRKVRLILTKRHTRKRSEDDRDAHSTAVGSPQIWDRGPRAARSRAWPALRVGRRWRAPCLRGSERSGRYTRIAPADSRSFQRCPRWRASSDLSACKTGSAFTHVCKIQGVTLRGGEGRHPGVLPHKQDIGLSLPEGTGRQRPHSAPQAGR